VGYFRGVIHGTVIGTMVGLCIAPQEGSRTRAQVQRAVEQARSGVQRAQETARTVMPVAQSAARSVAEAAGSMRGSMERMRHHEEAEPYVSVNSSGNGSPGSTDH
jgi:gas vesicle protein